MALELLLKWIISLFDVPKRHIVAYLKCLGHMAAEVLTMSPNRAVEKELGVRLGKWLAISSHFIVFSPCVMNKSGNKIH